MAYIHYDSKPNGVTYVSIYEFYREVGKVKTSCIETLGRVVDEDNGIFSCREKIFKYMIEEGKTAVPDTMLTEPIIPEMEKLILDFGDAWFLEEYTKRLTFCQSIYEILPDDSNTVLSLVFYRLLTNKQVNCHAKIKISALWTETKYRISQKGILEAA